MRTKKNIYVDVLSGLKGQCSYCACAHNRAVLSALSLSSFLCPSGGENISAVWEIEQNSWICPLVPFVLCRERERESGANFGDNSLKRGNLCITVSGCLLLFVDNNAMKTTRIDYKTEEDDCLKIP